MKNYFIANGEVLNTNMSAEEIELRVQESLDEYTSGMAQFRISLKYVWLMLKVIIRF